MKKKVIIFTGAISSGGAEKQSVLLAKALNEKYNVSLISYFGERELMRYINFLVDNDIPYYQLKGSPLKKVSEFYKLIKQLKPNTIINFLPSNNVIGGLVGRLFGVKQILGGVRSSRQSTLKYLELLISHYLFNNLTVFNNYSGFEYFTKRGFIKRKSLVIPNCIYPLPEKRNYDEKTNELPVNILIVSRFEYYKDYYTALSSIKKANETLIDKKIVLTIVGTGSEESQIKKWVNDFSLEKITTININPENIHDFYLEADIFIQTSLFEGFSNSIMEAMSYSLPVIATNVGDNNILIKEGVNGFLTDVKDIDSICERILKLVNSARTRKEMGIKGFKAIQNNFSIIKFGDSFSKLIKN